MKTEFFMGVIQEPQFSDREISTDNFESIQQAVDACASAGGGTVISVFRNISFTNVRGSGAKVGIMLKGLPEQKLEDIMLQDIDLTAQEAMVCSDVSGLVMERVVLREM